MDRRTYFHIGMHIGGQIDGRTDTQTWHQTYRRTEIFKHIHVGQIQKNGQPGEYTDKRTVHMRAHIGRTLSYARIHTRE